MKLFGGQRPSRSGPYMALDTMTNRRRRRILRKYIFPFEPALPGKQTSVATRRQGAAHGGKRGGPRKENQRLIEAIFRELDAQKTHGVRIKLLADRG
jgi:hypothetical protein